MTPSIWAPGVAGFLFPSWYYQNRTRRANVPFILCKTRGHRGHGCAICSNWLYWSISEICTTPPFCRTIWCFVVVFELTPNKHSGILNFHLNGISRYSGVNYELSYNMQHCHCWFFNLLSLLLLRFFKLGRLLVKAKMWEFFGAAGFCQPYHSA